MIPHIKSLGLVEYRPTWDAMKKFTAERTSDTRDEIWLVQHPPVYTQGLAGMPEHLLHNTDIPVVKIDRGGQIAHHRRAFGAPRRHVFAHPLHAHGFADGLREQRGHHGRVNPAGEQNDEAAPRHCRR